MSEESASLRQAVLDTARRMLSDGLAKGSQGNVSARLASGDRIAVTPTALVYEDMDLEDIAVIDLEGQRHEGRRKATSELPLHLAIYSARPDIGAVVHSHAPYSSVFAALGEQVPLLLIEAAAVLGRPIPVAPFAAPGSEALGASAAEALQDGFAVLLARHGLLTVGSNLPRAYEATLAAESSALAGVLARGMGTTPSPLDPETVAAAHAAFLKANHRKSGSGEGNDT